MPMQRRNVMVNGLPGKMAMEIARAIDDSDDLYVVRASFTGPEITETSVNPYNNLNIGLWTPAEKERQITNLKNQYEKFISVDYTHPSAVNDNADFYCRHNLPFVMGTTGFDRKALEERVKASETCAVIAPNMALPIVSLMDFMENYSKANEGALRGCTLGVMESHQAGKADTSGTARAMLKYFARLGIKMEEKLVSFVEHFKMEKPENVTLPLGYDSQFTLIRKAETQLELGIPQEHLQGHGWHTYGIKPSDAGSYLAIFKLRRELDNFFMDGRVLKGYSVDFLKENMAEAISPDKTVLLRAVELREAPGILGLGITHNINGRSVYVDGTLEAVRFLQKKIDAGEKGKVYSMIYVLNG